MIFFAPFLLSASFNLDTLSISSILKSKNIKIFKYSIILISILTTVTTFLFMYLGKILSTLLIKQYSNIFGCILISFIGLYYLIEHIRIQESEYGYDTSYYYQTFVEYKLLLIHPEYLLNKTPNILSFKDTFLVAISLSLNNCIIGFAAGIIGINIPITIFLNFILTILLFIISPLLKKSSIFSNYNYMFSSILLILIGIFKMFI